MKCCVCFEEYNDVCFRKCKQCVESLCLNCLEVIKISDRPLCPYCSKRLEINERDHARKLNINIASVQEFPEVFVDYVRIGNDIVVINDFEYQFNLNDVEERERIEDYLFKIGAGNRFNNLVNVYLTVSVNWAMTLSLMERNYRIERLNDNIIKRTERKVILDIEYENDEVTYKEYEPDQINDRYMCGKCDNQQRYLSEHTFKRYHKCK